MAHQDKDIQVVTDITALAQDIQIQDRVREAVQITEVAEVAVPDQRASADGPTELMQQAAKELLVQLLDPV